MRVGQGFKNSCMKGLKYQKSGPERDRKHCLLFFSSLYSEISLVLCIHLIAKSGHDSVKTACSGKVQFSQNFGKTRKNFWMMSQI